MPFQWPHITIHPTSFPFIIGFLSAIGAGLLVKVLIGIKMKLYLVGREPDLSTHSLIPLTAELKKRSLWKTLTQKNWKEDVEITLCDYAGQSFIYGIKYHLWNGFSLTLVSKPREGKNSNCLIDEVDLEIGESYNLRTGMTLINGDRRFTVLITTANLEAMSSQKDRDADTAARESASLSI